MLVAVLFNFAIAGLTRQTKAIIQYTFPARSDGASLKNKHLFTLSFGFTHHLRRDNAVETNNGLIQLQGLKICWPKIPKPLGDVLSAKGALA